MTRLQLEHAIELLFRIDEFAADQLPEMTTHDDLKARLLRWEKRALPDK